MPVDPLSLVPIGIGILSVGGYLFAHWYGSAAERAFRKAARYDVASFPDGADGRITGQIEAFEGKLVCAPLSGRECVAYAVRVEEYKREGGRAGWEAIVRDFDAANFVVSDATGRALVRAAGSWPSPIMERAGTTGLLSRPTPELEELLQAQGESSHGLVFRKQLRAYEGVLAVGMRVAVLGKGRRSKDPREAASHGGCRQEPGGLVIECLDDGSLLMSNAPSALR
jgi:hypothetical protein